jgi:hypothetical protein
MRHPVEAHIENFILTDGGHREPVCRSPSRRFRNTFPENSKSGDRHPGRTCRLSQNAATRSDNIRENVDMGTVRLNYRFGGAMAAKD